MFYEIPDLKLQSGVVRPRTILSYRTYGTLSRDRSNAILLGTPFSAQHQSLEWMIGPENILDTTEHFIIVPDMFGNGLSSSPIQHDSAASTTTWNNFTIYDNVMAQYRLVTEHLNLSRLALTMGWSMGGQLAYQWASSFPNMVEKLCVICGSAKTSPHNFVFLEGVKATLTGILGESSRTDEDRNRALRSVARIYAGWALSQAFYRQKIWYRLGYSSLEDFLQRYWEKSFLRFYPENLLAHIWTWQNADISANKHYGGDIFQALSDIRTQTLLMPSETDLYFTADDSRLELQSLKNATLLPIQSIWGHRAGMPVYDKVDQAFIKQAVSGLLAS